MPSSNSSSSSSSSLRFIALAIVALAAVHSGPASPVGAIEIEGPWAKAVDFPNGTIQDVSPGTVTVGDGTANNAANAMVHAPFPLVTLAATDDFVELTGTVTLIGTGNFAATSSSPKTQFRFGLFNGDNIGPNDNGWVGYYMSNKHGNKTGANLGTLGRKPVGNTSAYLSATGQNVLASLDGYDANDEDASIEEYLFWDGTYEFGITIQRDEDGWLNIFAYLAGLTENQPNGYFSQILFAQDNTAATQGTYTFNRVGFLLGSSLGVDQAIFNDLIVNFNPVDDSADFDEDGDVDGADFLLWQRGVGTPDGMAVPGDGDANRDGYVDFEDLNIWKTQMDAGEEPEEPEEEFVLAARVANVPVPEPSAACLVLIALTAIAAFAYPRTPFGSGAGTICSEDSAN